MTVTIQEAPRRTANPAPPRPVASVRRTSSIDVAWPEGAMGDKVMHGRSRDFVTSAEGRGRARAEASLEAVLKADRMIAAIAAVPTPPQLQRLVGERGGGHLRMLMREIMPELIDNADPLYLLLDDISGTSLVCSWAWSLWNPDWMAAMRETTDGDMQKLMEERINVCWGFQPGSASLNPERRGDIGQADGGELRNPADPAGWHEFPALEGVTMRRARRIDVWRDEAGLIRIDSAFQDSAPRPDGTRAALHEYRLEASADPVTLELLSLRPEARVLPFGECPGAITNALGLIGSPLPLIRESVLNDLRGPKGCTHLNDALRALADVPKLVGYLE
ncbi:MAG: DUF2889 domain-containing protein [Novosphingobium sp.]